MPDLAELDPQDITAITSKSIPLTQELLDGLAERIEAARPVVQKVLDAMTSERAVFVRRLRVDEGLSWRAIARQCHEAWGGGWEPPEAQMMGMEICEKAAKMFGEDYFEPPWN